MRRKEILPADDILKSYINPSLPSQKYVLKDGAKELIRIGWEIPIHWPRRGTLDSSKETTVWLSSLLELDSGCILKALHLAGFITSICASY